MTTGTAPKLSDVSFRPLLEYSGLISESQFATWAISARFRPSSELGPSGESMTTIREPQRSQLGETDRNLMRLLRVLADENPVEDYLSEDVLCQVSGFLNGAGSDGYLAIRNMLAQELAVPEAARKLLHGLGLVSEAATAEWTRWLAESGLRNEDFRVRDGALLALEALDDEKAIPALETAIAAERVVPLKADMEAVLRGLRGS